MAFYRVEPFGDDWLQAATISSSAINPHIKNSIPIADFIPKYVNRREEMSDEQIATTLSMIARAF